MPATVCATDVSGTVAQDRDADILAYDELPGSTLWDAALSLLSSNDGDFQHAEYADLTIRVTDTWHDGTATHTRTRCFDGRLFPSISELFCEYEGERYFEIMDCFAA